MTWIELADKHFMDIATIIVIVIVVVSVRLRDVLIARSRRIK